MTTIVGACTNVGVNAVSEMPLGGQHIVQLEKG